MNDAKEAKQLTGELDKRYPEEAGLETADLRIKLHLVESQALRRIREEVWKMKSAADIEHVSEALKTSLETLEIPYAYCGINVLDLSFTPPMVNYHTAAKKGEWKIERELQESLLVVQLWQAGVPSYRSDLNRRYLSRAAKFMWILWLSDSLSTGHSLFAWYSGR